MTKWDYLVEADESRWLELTAPKRETTEAQLKRMREAIRTDKVDLADVWQDVILLELADKLNTAVPKAEGLPIVKATYKGIPLTVGYKFGNPANGVSVTAKGPDGLRVTLHTPKGPKGNTDTFRFALSWSRRGSRADAGFFKGTRYKLGSPTLLLDFLVKTVAELDKTLDIPTKKNRRRRGRR